MLERMTWRNVILASAAVACTAQLACQPEPWRLERAGVEVQLTTDGTLTLSRDGVERLRSNSGPAAQGSDRQRAGDAYAPFATARTERREVDEVFGFFEFYDRLFPFVRVSVQQATVDGSRLSLQLSSGGSGTISIADDGAIEISWQLPAAQGDRLAMSFACGDDERFFGMGAQVSVEHRGYRVPVWTQEQGIGKAARGEPPMIFGVTGAHYDSYAPVPFALSTRPLGLWLDGTQRSEWDFCQQGETLRVQAEGGALRLVVFPATDMAQAVEQFTARTGRPRRLNRWTFAPWFDSFGGPAAVATAAALLREQRIPASALWAEDWVGTLRTLGGQNLTYDWSEDPARYPDLAATAALLHEQALRFLVYVNPYVPRDAASRAALEPANALVRDDAGQVLEVSFPFGEPPALVDPTAAAAQDVFDQFLGDAVAKGVDGWMADYGEALPYSAHLADGRSGAQAHNDYPRLWAEMSRRFWDSRQPDGDFAFFSRSGFTGCAAVQHVHWLGDQLTSFDRNDGLGSVVPLYLSAGLSGIALTHSDIGGYTSVGSSVRTRELLLRWLGLEAFTPIFRTHHTSNPDANLQWSSDADLLQQFGRYARWHQRLVPYFTSVAAQANEHGWPAVRPLWWGAEQQRELLAVDDAFLVGDKLLVAPVVLEGATERQLPLPPGRWRRWRAFDAPFDPVLVGGADVVLDAATEETPLLVRAGAALPLLARDYDGLAPPRTARPRPEFARTRQHAIPRPLDVAPIPLDAMMLLLVAGGDDDGALDHPELGELRWQWRGAELDRGPIETARRGGAALPTCQTEIDRNCLDGDVTRLGGDLSPGVEIVLTHGSGQGTLQVWSPTLSELLIELR